MPYKSVLLKTLRIKISRNFLALQTLKNVTKRDQKFILIHENKLEMRLWNKISVTLLLVVFNFLLT